MATKPKTHPYAIMYNDNTHVIYEITTGDYSAICMALVNEKPAVSLSSDVGVITLKDVRAVVKQKIEQEPATSINESAEPPMSAEEKEWVKMMLRGGGSY